MTETFESPPQGRGRSSGGGQEPGGKRPMLRSIIGYISSACLHPRCAHMASAVGAPASPAPRPSDEIASPPSATAPSPAIPPSTAAPASATAPASGATAASGEVAPAPPLPPLPRLRLGLSGDGGLDGCGTTVPESESLPQAARKTAMTNKRVGYLMGGMLGPRARKEKRFLQGPRGALHRPGTAYPRPHRVMVLSPDPAPRRGPSRSIGGDHLPAPSSIHFLTASRSGCSRYLDGGLGMRSPQLGGTLGRSLR